MIPVLRGGESSLALIPVTVRIRNTRARDNIPSSLTVPLFILVPIHCRSFHVFVVAFWDSFGVSD